MSDMGHHFSITLWETCIRDSTKINGNYYYTLHNVRVVNYATAVQSAIDQING